MRPRRTGDTALTGVRQHQWQWPVALFVLLMSSGLLTAGTAERSRPIRIGALTESWGPTPGIDGLRDGLRALGYREEAQFVIGVRFTQGDLAALPAAARALVQDKVDIIFVTTGNAAKAAQMATSQIPIVFAGGGSDPVGLGLIQSFARPGGNITGVADLRVELGQKRLEIFREIIPGLKRVLYTYDPSDINAVAEARISRDAAHHLGIVLIEQAVRTQGEAQATLARAQKGDVDGILASISASLNIGGFILEATAQRAIPSMFAHSFLVERGGLASYGPDVYDSGQQAARLVDKILKGANPAEIPVEVNSKIEFVINLKVAKTLGLTIAPEVLCQANQLIR